MRAAHILAALVVLGLSTTTAAQTTPLDDADARRAIELTEQGRAAYESGDVPGAIVAFEQAWDVTRDPAFAFNLGALYEAVGDLPRARAWLETFLEVFPEAPNAEDVRGMIDRLTATLDREWARIAFEATPADARVFVVDDAGDAYFLGETPFEHHVQPGAVALRFQADYHYPWDVELNPRAGARLTLAPDLEPRSLWRWRVQRRCSLGDDLPACASP